MLTLIKGFLCYSCVSDARYIGPPIRRILGSQRDTFYWPIDGKSEECHNEIPHFENNQVNSRDKIAHVCSERDACIILSPNLDLNFTIRGCVKQILRYELGEEKMLQKDGCFLIRSKPLFPGEPSISYIACICSKPLCNHEPQQMPVDEGVINDKKLIHELIPIIPRSIIGNEMEGNINGIIPNGHAYRNSRRLVVKVDKPKKEEKQIIERGKVIINMEEDNENNEVIKNEEWYAQEWAEKLVKKGTLAHRPNNKYGENIAMICGGQLIDSIDMWYDEVNKYDFESIDTNFKALHFSQLVWLSSKKIGFGIGKDTESNKYIIVANFDPKGNVMRKFKDNVLPRYD
uniref:SCP domain-containing protein n=1 Tax=Parastrongyloides trichosuri TaxID=131310 RepID=A0A0N4ZTT1_PARTI